MGYCTRAISIDAIQNGEFQSLTPIAEKHLTNQGIQRASEGSDLRAMTECPLMRHRLIQSQRMLEGGDLSARNENACSRCGAEVEVHDFRYWVAPIIYGSQSIPYRVLLSSPNQPLQPLGK
ncbi:hypothetical protein U1Q18_027419 [Sarracenia purpurea var. burkii]